MSPIIFTLFYFLFFAPICQQNTQPRHNLHYINFCPIFKKKLANKRSFISVRTCTFLF
ncbi:hypothetical protein AAHE18_12G057200 [Arachis hypogaea]